MNERIQLYSSSLYDVAKENDCAKEVYESLMAVKDILSGMSDYTKLMNSAAIEAAEREMLLDNAFLGSIHAFVLNFMKMLAKKRIFDIFIPCAESFEKSYFKDNNTAHARIITAIELNDAKKEEITKRISVSSGKDIIPKFCVDESIIGGIVIETENSSIDASVDGRLRSIKRHIGKN